MISKIIFLIFLSPASVFEQLSEKPKWVYQFFVLLIIQIALEALKIWFSSEQMFLPIALKSVSYSLTCFVLSFTLFQIAVFLGKTDSTVSFSAVVSVVVYSSAILALSAGAELLAGIIKWQLGQSEILVIASIIGADALLRVVATNALVLQIAQKITVFSIWYLYVLAIGFSIISGINKTLSVIVVSIVWLFGVGLQFVIIDTAKNLTK